MAMKDYSAFPKAHALQLDCLLSYVGHLLRGSYASAEIQSVYSAVPANWAW